ncbi:MAG: enoyl-CoA hydratase/isomerase family protein [Phycisphaerales bacterium]|nr:MAG: enoyl-CoA hydratase/isomerase family protein [Phycisphaerales bacterium]
MNDCEFVQVERSDGVARVTMNRPPLNVLNVAMMKEFNRCLEPLVASTDLAAVVIAASGKAFSAGVDVADHTAGRVDEMIRVFHAIFRKLASTDALTIAAVQGAALGGGCELACFCDVVLASDRAKFGQPEVQVGVFPPVAACVLPLRIGLGKAVELTALGATLGAAEAHRIGLVNHVYPQEEFESKVEEFLNGVRGLSRPVVRLAKRATMMVAREQVLAHLERAESLYLNDLMKLSDAHEGIAAFQEKRAPVWRHG